jgi:hypothetical protein
MTASEKIAAATKRLRELRVLADKLPEADRAKTVASIDRIASDLAAGVARAMRRK